ncbi:hypothetical protein SA50_2558 [Salmonella enterica subsp. enterica serovar Agona str. 50.E.08]|nr:hypothetical protein SA50_2558 [Salmonella enterica subsp. enterica serovar Agona str. 50.E.08]
MSADDIPNAGEKRWLSIEAGLLLRAHGLRYPTRSLMPCALECPPTISRMPVKNAG